MQMDQQRNYPPRLYAEGESNLDNKAINHTGIKYIDIFRDSVGETVWNEIKEHPTGIAAKIFEKTIIWSGKTVHYLLCRQLRVRKKEVWFLIGGQPIRFGLNEFEHVTGLTTYPLPTEQFEPEADYRAFFRELNVPAGEGPTLDELINGVRKCRAWPPQDSKRKWLGRLFLLAIGIHGLHHNSRIPLDSAKRVFDDEALNNYPWGRVAFQSLVGSIKTINPTGRTYTVNGLVYALQAWAYESIKCFGEHFGKESDGDMCPLLRWQGSRTRRELGPVIDEEIVKNDGKVRVRHMIENARGLYPEWPDEPEDPKLDNLIQDIADEKFVSGFWDKEMPVNEKKKKKKKKKKRPDDKDDSQHPKKKHKALKEKDKDVDFDESVGNKNDEPKDSNEEADNGSLRRLIMDMESSFRSSFDNLDTSMNGMSSRLEKVESELTELNKWIYANRFRIRNMFAGGNSSTAVDPPSTVGIKSPVPVAASTQGKVPVVQSPSTYPPPPMKYASSHPLGKDAKSLDDVQKNLNTADTDDLIEVVDRKDDGKKKKHDDVVRKDDGKKKKHDDVMRSPINLRKNRKTKTVVIKDKEETKTVNDKESKKAKADATKALNDKQALEGKLGKRRRGRPKKADNVNKSIGNPEANEEELTSADDALNILAGESVKADDVADGKANVDDVADGKANVDDVADGKANVDEPQKILGDDGVKDNDDDEDAMRPESEDDDEDEQTRLKLISDIRNQSVKLSIKGKDTSKLKDRPKSVFPTITDDGLKCMRKHCEPSAAIYDPMAPVDPDRFKKLTEHIASELKSSKLGNCNDHKEFYRVIITPRSSWPEQTWGWLNESHISAYQRVLRRRLITEPCPYHTKCIAFVDQYFTTFMVRDYHREFKKSPKEFTFNGTNYEAVVKGLYPDDQETRTSWLNEVWHVYFVVHTGGNHWVALDVDLARGHIDCYDSIYDPEKKSELLEACRPIREMIPYMVNDIFSTQYYPYKPFTFRWKSPKNVPQNVKPGDCGVYALKYIECLALGVTFDGLCDGNIQGLRIKMAADILAEAPEHYNGFIN